MSEFYKDVLQGYSDRTRHDENTLRKVYDTLIDEGLSLPKATEIVGALLNAGIRFQERSDDDE